MKKFTNLIKVYLRQLSKNPKKTTTHNVTTQRWTIMKKVNGQAKRNNKSSFPAKTKNW